MKTLLEDETLESGVVIMNTRVEQETGRLNKLFLHFESPEVEKEFSVDYYSPKSVCIFLLLCILYVVVLLPNNDLVSLLVHLAICLPVLVISIAFLWFMRTPKVIDIITFACTFTLSSGLLYESLWRDIADSSGHHPELPEIVITTLMSYFLPRPRFWVIFLGNTIPLVFVTTIFSIDHQALTSTSSHFISHLFQILAPNIIGMIYMFFVELFMRRKFAKSKLLVTDSIRLLTCQLKTEKLVQSTLGQTLTDTLREDPDFKGEYAESLTVLFSDVVGFTQWCTKHEPEEVVSMLDEMFSEFDMAAVANNVEKMQTIGDAYFCAGGLRDPLVPHTRWVVNMALDMLAAVERLNARRGYNLQIRIGVHAGPAIVGVVGSSCIKFEILGEIIPIAHNLESNGLPGRIHVSEQVFHQLRDWFTFEPRISPMIPLAPPPLPPSSTDTILIGGDIILSQGSLPGTPTSTSAVQPPPTVGGGGGVVSQPTRKGANSVDCDNPSDFLRFMQRRTRAASLATAPSTENNNQPTIQSPTSTIPARRRFSFSQKDVIQALGLQSTASTPRRQNQPNQNQNQNLSPNLRINLGEIIPIPNSDSSAQLRATPRSFHDPVSDIYPRVTYFVKGQKISEDKEMGPRTSSFHTVHSEDQMSSTPLGRAKNLLHVVLAEKAASEGDNSSTTSSTSFFARSGSRRSIFHFQKNKNEKNENKNENENENENENSNSKFEGFGERRESSVETLHESDLVSSRHISPHVRSNSNPEAATTFSSNNRQPPSIETNRKDNGSASASAPAPTIRSDRKFSPTASASGDTLRSISIGITELIPRKPSSESFESLDSPTQSNQNAKSPTSNSGFSIFRFWKKFRGGSGSGGGDHSHWEKSKLFNEVSNQRTVIPISPRPNFEQSKNILLSTASHHHNYLPTPFDPKSNPTSSYEQFQPSQHQSIFGRFYFHVRNLFLFYFWNVFTFAWTEVSAPHWTKISGKDLGHRELELIGFVSSDSFQAPLLISFFGSCLLLASLLTGPRVAPESIVYRKIFWIPYLVFSAILHSILYFSHKKKISKKIQEYASWILVTFSFTFAYLLPFTSFASLEIVLVCSTCAVCTCMCHFAISLPSRLFLISTYLFTNSITVFFAFQNSHLFLLEILSDFFVTFVFLVVSAISLNSKFRETVVLAEQVVSVQDQMAAEQQKFDSLLLNALPESIAARLQKNPTQCIVDVIEEASVLFFDLSNFHEISQRMSAPQVLGVLGYLFTAFDKFAKECGCDKIKSIGSIYMASAGVVSPCTNHASRLASMSLKMSFFVDSFSRSATRLNIFSGSPVYRMGMHCGKIVAGVLGQDKFLYDIFGDCVNISSRLQTTTLPNTIQISSLFREKLGKEFSCQLRGPQTLKGVPKPIETFFLTGRESGD